jgi:hypothetical protein
MLWLLILLTLGLLFAGCDTSGSGGKVSGRIILEGESSHGEVTVELYAAGSTDPIWPIVSAHPCIGFGYSPAAHFDWRIQQPLYTTTTDPAGNYGFPDTPDGDYVLCARCDSFGWNPPASLTVQGGDLVVGTISLYPETIFPSGVLQESTTLEEDHHYVFDGPLVVDQGVVLTIEPGAVLRFAQDMSLHVNGTLAANGTPEKWVVWTCDSDTLLRAQWNMVQFTSMADPPSFSYNRVEGGYQGIVSYAEGGVFDHCFFRRMDAAALAALGQSPRVISCVFYDIGGLGTSVGDAADARIESCLFYGNGSYGISASRWDAGTIHNNWFQQCGTSGDEASIHILLCKNVHFTHNEVVDCWTGMHFGSKCDSTNLIQANVFTRIHKGIYLGVTEDNRGPSYPTVHYNCFTDITGVSGVILPYCIHIGVCYHNNRDVQASENYWDTVSEMEINDCMWDGLDEDGCPFVLTTPFMTACPDSAGIIC